MAKMKAARWHNRKDVRVEDVTITKKSLGEISIDVKEKDLSYYAVIGKNILII